jgi:hypothetical protein
MVSRHTALRILLKIPLPSVAVPQAAQVSDRWHLWHLLGGVAAGDARTPRGVAGAGKFARQAVAASYRAP